MKMKKRVGVHGFATNCLLVFLILVSGIACNNSNQYSEKVDEIVQRYVDQGRFNGCLLVVKNQKVIYNKAFGLANPETNEALTLNHRLRLASVTKHFTGVAIMILKEQGKLNFDDDIRKYLPELPYEGITIRQVLSHNSGLPDYGDLLENHWDTIHAGTPERKIANNYTVLDLLVKYQPPVLFAPGENHQYSNTGYNLLALVVERASGETFQDFMMESVFKPSGMNHTFVNAADGSLPDELRARGFREAKDESGYYICDEHYQNGMFGDGGIYSTARDMLLWDQVLCSAELVSQETLQEAFSKSKLNNEEEVEYGFGWSVFEDERGDFFAHGCGRAGFSTFMLRDYQNGNAIVQLCNGPGIRRGELAFAIYELLHNGEYTLPETEK